MLPGISGCTPGSSFGAAVALSDTLFECGLTTPLELCLDAGDANSYTSGTQWIDTGGHQYDFNFGATTAAPTFNGVAGTLSSAEFMSFDGGDDFTYEAANPTWVNAIHKDNAECTFAAWIKPATLSAAQAFTGTGQLQAAGIGLDFGCNASGALRAVCRAGGTNAMAQTLGGTLATGVWQFVAWSLDEAAGATGLNVVLNSTVTNGDATYTSPSASAAGQVIQIGAAGGNLGRVQAGFQMAQAVWWSRALTVAELRLLFEATRVRFGV
jgi:hypothetical protein